MNIRITSCTVGVENKWEPDGERRRSVNNKVALEKKIREIYKIQQIAMLNDSQDFLIGFTILRHWHEKRACESSDGK